MNVKEVKMPTPTVHFKDIKIGEVFQSIAIGTYLVKTEPFEYDGSECNAMTLKGMKFGYWQDADEVIPCQHQINVWY